MEDLERMRELRQQGFFCSQIILNHGIGNAGKNQL